MSTPKLNKLLLQGLNELGFSELNETQTKLLPRISGGASLFLSGIETEEKTRILLVSVLQKLNYSIPDAPRVLVLVSSSEEAVELHAKFSQLAKFMDLKIRIAHEDGHIDDQNMAIYEGADLVIATPKRLTKLYFQNSINVNKINLFVLYNATRIIDARYHVELARITDSLPKFQSLIFTEKVNDKLKRACAKFMPHAQEIHIESTDLI